MGEWFTREIADTGRLRLFCFLVAFIAGFLFIRFSVRMIRRQVRWWPGNVTPGGHHIHHVVFGLVFMCVGGVGGLSVQDGSSGWAAVTAAVFGVGTALVLDEFALVLHLEDVYWSEQGRLSVEVVFITMALGGLLLLGLKPLGVDDVAGDGLWAIMAVLVFDLLVALVALAKGKVWTGLIGLFIGLVAMVGAVRLARPGSPWARRRYRPGSRKERRAMVRERRYRLPLQRLGDRLSDLIAGRPSISAGTGGADEDGSRPGKTRRPS
ncbi:integral membrane protein [Mycobacterium tuberculosis]|nr:integral membrane protein [Mycobacterium tuberculosis]